MRFGLFGGARAKKDGPHIDSQGYQSYIDYVIEADQLGFHDSFGVEHHFTGVGQVSSLLNLLTYLAARTKQIRLGSAVVVLPWHNPALLAEQVATLDLLSGGRFDFGIGKGYRKVEFRGFGIDPAEAHDRYEETLAFLHKAWSSGRERFSFHGKFWSFTDVVIEPMPLQQPHPPLWVGAGSKDGIERAARGGYNLLLDQIAPFDEITERVEIYRRTKLDAGFDYDPMQIGVTRALHIVRTEAEREQAYKIRSEVTKAISDLARGRKPDSYDDPRAAAEASALIGTPEEIIEKLHMMEQGGVAHVLLIDVTGSRDSLRLFANEIMPAFAEPTLQPTNA